MQQFPPHQYLAGPAGPTPSYGRDDSVFLPSSSRNPKALAAKISLANKNNWPALARAAGQALGQAGIRGGALGDGERIGGVKVSDTALPHLPIELWSVKSLTDSRELASTAGSAEFADRL